MKRAILASALIIVFVSASFAGKLVAEGKTFTALGNYKIEQTDNPAFINREDCKAFLISYENSPLQVTVVVYKDLKCKKYIVLSEKLSVQYVCNKSYFGVEKLDKAFENQGFRTSDSDLNRSEFFHQKVISHGMSGEIENTQLIAAYFPMLLNNITAVVAAR